jgi:hypothetical protein
MARNEYIAGLRRVLDLAEEMEKAGGDDVLREHMQLPPPPPEVLHLREQGTQLREVVTKYLEQIGEGT